MDEEQQSLNQDQDSNWEYNADGKNAYDGEAVGQQQSSPSIQVTPVEWDASEYVANEKSAGWFLGLLAGSILLVALVFFVTEGEILPTIAILVACITVGLYGARKPATKHYSVDNKGVHIENNFHPFQEFRSFSIVEEGAVDSVWLSPLKRFAPMIIMYFSPDDEKKIIDVLANFLPHEQRELDAIDKFSKRMNF